MVKKKRDDRMVLPEYDEEKTMSALKKQYFNQGITQGRTNTILDLVKQGLLTKEQGAEQLGISISELDHLLKKELKYFY